MQRVILAPGQGAQAISMAKAWCEVSAEAQSIFDLADAALTQLPGGAKLSELCFNGPAEVLNRTDVSQPAIFTASVACWNGLTAQWRQRGELAPPVAAAGLSLGEYTALHLAGVFGFAEGLALVGLRGQAMQQAAEATPSGMVALIGADEAKAIALCEQARAAAGPDSVLVCANFNAPGQIVISGSKLACEKAVEFAGQHGVRGQALAVAGAFHSPIMKSAADLLGAKLAATAMKPPNFAVYSNVTAKPHADDAALIRQRLVDQLTSPVRWAESCLAMVRDGSLVGAEYHELAPGRTLSGLFKRINRDTVITNHDQPT